jgi:hypothetical protein
MSYLVAPTLHRHREGFAIPGKLDVQKADDARISCDWLLVTADDVLEGASSDVDDTYTKALLSTRMATSGSTRAYRKLNHCTLILTTLPAFEPYTLH